jgi:tetratricopeptide (TPR) repeat protein
MAEAGFNANIEKARLAGARELPSSCLEDFQRLSRTLIYGPAFQWLLVDAPDEALRKQVMEALDEVLHAASMRTNRLPLSAKITDVAMLEARLLKNASRAEVVHVVGRPGWFNEARWDAFNVRRERLAAGSRARLVFWLDAEAIALASRGAPDLWAWRGGVYSFVPSGASLQAPMVRLDASGSAGGMGPFATPPEGADNRSHAERLQRIAKIRAWLSTVPTPSDDLLAAPINELGELLFSLGEYDAALTHWRDVAVPLYERLGNVRSKAITMGKIAHILQALGQLDEALRILSAEVHPEFERLGDVRSKAVTMGQIADILQDRGQLDEALRIRREEELPVYERLGDVRSKAMTMSKIAHILQARGQLDEALRILSAEVSPAFERLGDVRSKAVTMGQIAGILQARGQLDEALRILQEEELPVYERLGDVRSLLIGRTNLALLYTQRGQKVDRPTVDKLLREAHAAAQEMQLPEAEQIAGIYEGIFGQRLLR